MAYDSESTGSHAYGESVIRPVARASTCAGATRRRSLLHHASMNVNDSVYERGGGMPRHRCVAHRLFAHFAMLHFGCYLQFSLFSWMRTGVSVDITRSRFVSVIHGLHLCQLHLFRMYLCTYHAFPTALNLTEIRLSGAKYNAQEPRGA